MKRIIYLLTFLCLGTILNAQITLLNNNIGTVTVTPESILNVTIFNNVSQVEIVLEAELKNNLGEVLLSVQTLPFRINTGSNLINSRNYKITNLKYGNTNQAAYLRNQNKLPSGVYNYCVRVKSNDLESTDEICDEINTTDLSFLYLVSPSDGEVLETKTPLLTWMHSEPFSVITRGEEYRMVVVKLSGEQTVEEGIVSNTPVYVESGMNKHNQLYPINAKKLEYGERYGWQVQHFSNGEMINKTEAWEFRLPIKDPKTPQYNLLKRKLDAGYYIAYDDKVFFRFDEKYASKVIKTRIVNVSKKIDIAIETTNTDEKQVNLKQAGYNRYELDITNYKLKKGYYELLVWNEKNDLLKLKFYVE